MTSSNPSTIDWSQIRASILGEGSKKHLLPDVKLPVLPKAVGQFSQRAEDPEVSARELASIVEADAGLTCQLLKIVNASAGGLKHRISSAQHAIATLGIKKTKLYLLTAAVQNALPVRHLKLINLALFWNTNLERACLAQRLAKLFNADGDLAFAAALMLDFLLPILTNELDSQYLEFLKRQEKEPIELIEFERKVFGWDHAEAGARVMFDWGFPDDLICCLLFHHHGLSILAHPQVGKSTVAAVALSALMPDPLRQSPFGMDMLSRLSGIWKVFELQKTADLVYIDYCQQAMDADNYIPFNQRCAKYLEAAEKQTATVGQVS